MPTPQHEALHRILTHDKKLIARALRRVFDMDVEALVDVSILNTDYMAEPGWYSSPARRLSPAGRVSRGGQEGAAEWARKPITIGPPGIPCVQAYAIVLGPDNTPAITSLARAGDDVGFADLAAMTQSRAHDSGDILEVLHTPLSEIGEESAAVLSEFTESRAGEYSRTRVLEEAHGCQRLPLPVATAAARA